MFEAFFSYLDLIENFLWGYLAAPLLISLGIYFSFKSRFIQFRKFPQIVKTFSSFLTAKENKKEGVHPLKAFFACVGGCIGIGNIVGICTAVQIGGPGALFWIWVTAIVGVMLKYGEVYLGLLYRVPNGQGSYNGGPMYFLPKAFKSSWIPKLVALLLCVYGVEIYQFSIVVNSVSANLPISPYLIILGFLGMVIFASSGGVSRVGAISSAIIPLFVVIYVGMGTWVLSNHLTEIPAIFNLVFSSAFTGHAAIGGFAGSLLLLTMSQGVRRGCYTGDLGIGYASVIHSESSITSPEKQASLVIFDIFIDTFIICTTSVMMILVTNLWHAPIDASLLMQTALSQYFPYMNFFMPLFLFLLGYSTINAYFCVGIKCAEFLSPSRGRIFYYVYATCALFVFSLVDSTQAQTVMMIAGGLLLLINCVGIFRLRHQISYAIGEETEILQPAPVSSLALVEE